ncbi:hypothetical protein FRC10_005250 [Ceratobasidium sp. 414]|nr:hypothetical protein FRC10_005250 [Ceratobasidium sp. 414]
MVQLEYNLTHPHPKGGLFLCFTTLIFLAIAPVLILVNFATVGSELVPSLQSTFQPDDKLLQGWWGTGHLPAGWRPKPPQCQPRDLGRGDTFRLSASLFDYTVQSTWNTTNAVSASGIQQQERVEYRGQSFAGCFVNTTRFDYSLLDQTQTLSVGVICEGNTDYPVHVSMETVLVFARELSKDFIGQYYGSGQELPNITITNPSDYRRVVMAVLDVLSTDSLTIMSGQHLPQPVLSISLVLSVIPDTGATEPVASTITYFNGTQGPLSAAANIYADSMWNLVNAVNDAVNLDLGSYKYQNLYRNATAFKNVIHPNPPPAGIPPSKWAATPDSQSFYYGKITPPYQTWAQMLLAGRPVKVGTLTGLHDESAMVTTYLCPTYRVKSHGSLLASVFIGSATMLRSVWSVWMLFTTFVAKRLMAPRESKKAEEANRAVDSAESGVFARLAALVGLAKSPKPSLSHGDEE